MVMISLSTSPGCGPRFLAGWASSLSSRASQCGRNAWQKSSNWQKSSTSRSNIDASPHLMAPTQKEEFKGDKGLASPQTRNSGYHSGTGRPRVMAGPSGQAFGPPKGRLVPAIHVCRCVSPGPSWVAGPGPAMTQGQRPRPPPRSVSASADKPGHDDLGADQPSRKGTSQPACKGRPNLPAACCSTTVGFLRYLCWEVTRHGDANRCASLG